MAYSLLSKRSPLEAGAYDASPLELVTSEEVNRPPSGFRSSPFAEQSANCLKIETDRPFSDDRKHLNSDLRRQPPAFKTFRETDFTVQISMFFERINGDIGIRNSEFGIGTDTALR
jgi:hypothetical protein